MRKSEKKLFKKGAKKGVLLLKYAVLLGGGER